MASESKIKIVIEADDKATEPIRRTTESIREMGRETQRVTRESKKNWGGLADLFGQILPRNLRRLTRGFKSTQRQVGRLSKSFRVLKSAIVATGLGLLIVAIGELAANWDKVTEALGFTNVEAEKKKKLNKEIAAGEAAITSEVTGHILLLQNLDLAESTRKRSVEAINKALGDYVDTEASAMVQSEQAMELLMARIDLEEKQKIALDNVARENVLLVASANEKSSAAERRLAEEEWMGVALQSQRTTRELLEAQVEYDKLIEIGTKRTEERTDAEYKAAAAKKKTKSDAAADAKWLAGHRIQIAEETELRLIQDAEKRDLRLLEMQHEAAKIELEERTGSKEDLEALEKKHGLDMAEIVKDYQDQADEAQDVLDEKAAANREMVRAALATEEENELKRLKDKYAEEQLAAAGNFQALHLLEMKYILDEKAVRKKYDDEELEEEEKLQVAKLAAKKKLVGSVSGLLRELGDAAEEGSAQQKRLAIADVLVNQAMAMANAVAAAAKASKDGGPAAPFLFAAYVATMLGTIASTFTSIKSIMSDADAPTPSGGGMGGGRGGFAPTAQVPLPARIDSPDSLQAYVVQSQLQGQMNAQGKLHGQIVL